MSVRIYPLEAVLDACYAFLEKAYIFLDQAPSTGDTLVFIKPKNWRRNPDALKSEFLNELINSSLRYHIGKNNKKIREYIIGRALYAESSARNLSLVGQKDAPTCYQEDPLGIAARWEDKYEKKKKTKSAHLV